jgi:hypothetical protein
VGRLAAVLGLAVATLLARPATGQDRYGFSPGASANGAESVSTNGDRLLPPGDWTDEQRHELVDLIERTEAELPAFADLATIEALGFHNFGATAPGGYDHFMNPAWIDDDHILDPRYPESLVFRRTWDPETGESDDELVAAMFFLPNGYDMSNIPVELEWMPGWHVHPDVCVTDDMRFAGLANSDGTCSSGHPLEGPPMLHVWIADYECDHRFGEVDIDGVHCDLHGHDPDPHEPDPHEPDPHEPDPHEPGPHSPDPTQPGHGNDGGHDPDHDDDHSPTAPPARPVRGQPHYTG